MDIPLECRKEEKKRMPHPHHSSTAATTTDQHHKFTTSASPAQAWSILMRHARDEINPLRLQELCSDVERVNSLVTVHNSTYKRQPQYQQHHHNNEFNSNVELEGSESNNILLADFSRQKITLDTLNHLLRLCNSRDVKGFIQNLAWGQNDPENPISNSLQDDGGNDSNRRSVARQHQQNNRVEIWPSMHLALRVPNNQNKVMLTNDGKNALDDIHDEWNRIERLSSTLRKGVNNNKQKHQKQIHDVVVIGRGVAVLALQFVYEALKNDFEAEKGSTDGLILQDGGKNIGGSGSSCNGPRKMAFLTSLDPVSITNGLADLKAEHTIVVFISMHSKDELGLTFEIVKNWMTHALSSSTNTNKTPTKNSINNNKIVSDHLFIVTCSEKNIKGFHSNHCFVIPSHSRCEPFTTFTAASLFPLSIVFGWPIVSQMLSGAHDMDTHFVETNPRHNLPILLSLIDLWNDAFLGTSGRIITPFSQSFSKYSNFVAALESQTCGRAVDNKGNTINGVKNSSSAAVLDGTLHGTFDRMLYQGGRIIPSELIVAMDTQSKSNAFGQIANHDALICSYFAHADVLAFGTNSTKGAKNVGSWRFSEAAAATKHNFDSNSYSDGNRPSTLLICGRCDAFTCGQLLALSEHRALVTARLWDVDPFVQHVGSSVRYDECDRLQETLYHYFTQKEDDDNEDNEDKINFATATILKHYANRMLEQRHSYKNT